MSHQLHWQQTLRQLCWQQTLRQLCWQQTLRQLCWQQTLLDSTLMRTQAFQDSRGAIVVSFARTAAAAEGDCTSYMNRLAKAGPLALQFRCAGCKRKDAAYAVQRRDIIFETIGKIFGRTAQRPSADVCARHAGKA
jgi:hypothetical protein